MSFETIPYLLTHTEWRYSTELALEDRPIHPRFQKLYDEPVIRRSYDNEAWAVQLGKLQNDDARREGLLLYALVRQRDRVVSRSIADEKLLVPIENLAAPSADLKYTGRSEKSLSTAEATFPGLELLHHSLLMLGQGLAKLLSRLAHRFSERLNDGKRDELPTKIKLFSRLDSILVLPSTVPVLVAEMISYDRFTLTKSVRGTTPSEKLKQ
ncbi:uncharacterized protein Z519_04744 [Cladophialophora bantiana CBS 173.52]|uniref:Uncharacterized protein n=1 Tax=Cladophialophora bantiana (strain ATCC 10958 / CBS 173.52 / CDC B-1940 / NIH 8579) TaxID=1442370 RepID=A0A0D2G7Y7_CLAB1|nr:uncharacterized protein Z519_04744 [Cladophialophora bantiana CBS 173.52]KIW94767.1 hypothetical protein Z519_04744 [Cladophialophora bantiana CBS 173.52]